MKQTRLSIGWTVLTTTIITLAAASSLGQKPFIPTYNKKLLEKDTQPPLVEKPWIKRQIPPKPSTPVVTKLPLSDTDQRLCYSDVNSIACPAPGEAFYGQDSQYGWDTTFEPSARFTRDSSATAEPVVIDHVTGYTWQGCARGLTGADCSVGTVTTCLWADAAPYCEGLSWGGHSDWRLPNRWELESIVDLGRFEPAIDSTAFPATPILSTHPPTGGFTVPTSFWTSTKKTWPAYVEFAKGGVGRCGNEASYRYSIRCVRGEGAPQPSSLTKDTSTADQPVVEDSVTKLEWQGCAGGLSGPVCATGAATDAYFKWKDALAYCEGLSWGGRSDWRMPNRRELLSIIYLGGTGYHPQIDEAAFPATPLSSSSGSYFWTSTTKAEFVYSGTAFDQLSSWIVDFDTTVSTTFPRGSNKRHIRCVRGGL